MRINQAQAHQTHDKMMPGCTPSNQIKYALSKWMQPTSTQPRTNHCMAAHSKNTKIETKQFPFDPTITSIIPSHKPYPTQSIFRTNKSTIELEMFSIHFSILLFGYGNGVCWSPPPPPRAVNSRILDLFTIFIYIFVLFLVCVYF